MFSKHVSPVSGFVAVSLLACASASAATLKIAVAANFATPLDEVINNFKTAFPAYAGYTYEVTSGATGDFAAAIQTDINDGSISTYDIFIAADDIAPQQLYNYEGTTLGTHTLVGTPFFYAHGFSVVWSKPGGPNVAGGLPNPDGSEYSFAVGEVAIANPATAPYGRAATEVLQNWFGYTYSNSPTDIFSQFTNIGNTYNAVVAGTGGVTVGFVAKSQVCRNNKWSESGTFYQYAEGSDYTPLIQDAVVLTRTGVDVDSAARAAFAGYLANNITDTLLKYCYSIVDN